MIGEYKYKDVAKKIAELILFSVFVMIIEYFYFGLNKWDFKIPVVYDGGDAFSSLATMKMRMFGDSYRMGWPYYEDVTKYTPVFNMLSRIGSFLIGLYVEDYNVAQNVFLFCIPTLNALVCYLVFDSLKIRKWIAVLGALLYGFCPYVQMRLYLHQDLAAVECVPIVFLICFWLYEDSTFALPKRGYFKYKRNVILLFFSWMIANNGIVYYPFFGCFVILVTGIMISVQKKSFRKIVPAITVILNVVMWLAIGFIPAIRGVIDGRGDVATNGTVRDAFRSTLYGLDIKSLFLSPKGYGINRLLGYYDYLFKYDNEQYYAYMGIVGILGLTMLLALLFINSNSDNNIITNRMLLLSRVSVLLLLLGTAYGFGVIVAIFIPFIASYNRVSIYILFASIITVMFCADSLMSKYINQKRKQVIVSIAILIICIYSLFEQMKSYDYFHDYLLEENTIQLSWDKKFFEAVEESAGYEGMVFQLPYMSSFENLQEGNIYDYDHYRGYMNTKTTRWSYGAINGSVNDVWYENTSELEPQAMIEELRERGFSGIYINVDGYDDDYGKLLTNKILKELGTNEYILHESGLKIYIPINN